MMEMASKSDLKMEREFLTGSTYNQPLIASTTRSDLLEAAMRTRAEEPDFGVDYDYARWWVIFMVQGEHPELLRPYLTEIEHQKRGADYSVHLNEAEGELLAELETLVERKEGDAREITARTIKILKSFRIRQQ
jgi:hypothetical protein